MNKVISCAIFKPYIEYLSFNKEQYVFKYLDIHQHDQPQKLSKLIQTEINNAIGYDNIIILYGMCGGTLLSLEAVDIPLTLIKVHDCMSILLGSKERYKQLMAKTKSIGWSCYSLKEENYINDNISEWKMIYDEDTVEYLKTILLKEEEIYISLNLSQEKKYTVKESRIINGDLDFLRKIILLNSDELLYLYPHQKIKQTLDNNVFEVVKNKI